MKYSMRQSLKFRLTFLTVILIIIPMLVAGAYNIFNYSSRAKEEMKRNLESQNYAGYSLFEKQINEIYTMCKNVALEKGIVFSIQLQITSQLEEYMKILQSKYKEVDMITLYIINENRYIGEYSDINKLNDLVEKIKKTGNGIKGIEKNGEMKILAAEPVKSDTGEVIGVLFFESSLVKHNEFVGAISEKIKINTVLLDNDEVFISSEMGSGMKLYKKRPKIILPAEENDMSGIFSNTPVMIGNKEYYIYFTEIRDIYDNVVGHFGTMQNASELERIIDEILKNMLLITMASSGIAILITVLLLRVQLNPLRNLVDTLEEVGRGNLTIRAKIEKNDEIGAVAEYFNNTITKVEEMMNELDMANEKLKEADEVKDEFLATTSHELRTPLNGIIGLSESLADGIAGTLPDKANYNLGMIIASGKRLLALVNDILDMSKLKNQELVLRKKSVDIRQLAEMVMLINKPMADNKSIALKNELPFDFPMVDGDESRLEQILFNLLGNAIKFTEKGEVKVWGELKEGYVEIKITDTGIGIPHDKLEDIFNPFEQVDSSIARKYGGTGLGLGITKKLIELHGGNITVESVLGQGSTFTFTMPLASIDSEVVEETKESEHNVKNISSRILSETMGTVSTIEREMTEAERENEKRIIEEFLKYELKEKEALSDRTSKVLVVDDEPVNIQVMLDYLKINKIEADTALNGFDALEMIERNSYDIVILDIMMPRMSGYEVCKILRQRFSMYELPVLMLSAKNNYREIEMGFDAGANDYLTKPFDKKELFSRIMTLLNLKGAVEASIKNAKKYAGEKEKREIAEVLREVTNKMSAKLSVEHVFGVACRKSLEIKEFAKAKGIIKLNGDYEIFDYDKENDSIRKLNVQDIKNGLESLGKLLDVEEPVIYDNMPGGILETEGEDIAKCAVFPIIYRESRLGYFVFESSNIDNMDKDEMSFLQTLSAQAGIVMQNAKMYTQLEQWTRELEKTNKALEDSLEELKLTQDQLIISEKMAGLGSLVAGIAHEINTPVGIAVTASSVVEEEIKEVVGLYKTSKMTQKAFEEFLANTKESSRLIQNNLLKAAEMIRSFKQISVDQTSEEKREFKVKEYIGDIVRNLQPKLKQTNHSIEIECDEELKIKSYPGYYSQILTNFIMNSMNHGFEGIENGHMYISVVSTNEGIKLVYRDNGKGIPREIINRIYEPFFTTKPNKGGTGLGMHIVYNIVTQKLLGKISCDSSPGNGVEFVITSPLV